MALPDANEKDVFMKRFLRSVVLLNRTHCAHVISLSLKEQRFNGEIAGFGEICHDVEERNPELLVERILKHENAMCTRTTL